jgi:hypothetical protein
MRPKRSTVAWEAAVAASGVGDVECDRQQILMRPDRLQDRIGIAASRDDRVCRRQGLFGDVDPEASTCTGHKPHFAHRHSPSGVVMNDG